MQFSKMHFSKMHFLESLSTKVHACFEDSQYFYTLQEACDGGDHLQEFRRVNHKTILVRVLKKRSKFGFCTVEQCADVMSYFGGSSPVTLSTYDFLRFTTRTTTPTMP